MARTKETTWTIKSLRRAGIPVTPGNEYIPSAWLPKRPVSLEEVRRRLAKVRGSLAETVSRLRDQEG